jgi:hypothetical protein
VHADAAFDVAPSEIAVVSGATDAAVVIDPAASTGR